MTDLHNHLLPGVDDGAGTLEDSLDALGQMVEAGVRQVVVTPHFDASLVGRSAFDGRMAALDAAWDRFSEAVERHPSKVAAGRGVELRLDTPEPDLSDPRLRLNGGRFALVEFSHMTVPPSSERVIEHVRAAGYIPLLAHPERYSGLDPGADLADRWRRAGAYLQVNMGSLLGQYGEEVRGRARRILERGLADVLASDFHCRGEYPAARAAVARSVGEGRFELLAATNPGRIFDGEPPLPVDPGPSGSGGRSGWRGLFRRRRG